MSLSCSCDYGDAEWYYYPADDFSKLTTKRSRKCCSCGAKIGVGDTTMKFVRYRQPNSFIEECIHGDEVYMADWYMCEDCGGLYFAVEDLNMCCDISYSIKQQIAEYRNEEIAHAERMIRHK